MVRKESGSGGNELKRIRYFSKILERRVEATTLLLRRDAERPSTIRSSPGSPSDVA